MNCKYCAFNKNKGTNDAAVCTDEEEYIDAQGEPCCRYYAGAVPKDTDQQAKRIADLEAALKEITNTSRDYAWKIAEEALKGGGK